jgi:hypothetical protein
MKFFQKLFFVLLLSQSVYSQIDDDKMGAWYMYFFNITFNDGPWGVQGDVQYRNWNLGGDLEQLLLRSGLTYQGKDSNIKFTLGYGNITTGVYGDSNDTSSESRIYQEALYPVKFGKRFYTNHRFRYEQRFVEGQDFRTRYRYNLFLNIPLNNETITPKTYYIALYNELFINGQRDIGDNRSVAFFDRNRFYSGIGYVIKPGYKVQLGIMKQTTNTWAKSQLQFSFHHSF